MKKNKGNRLKIYILIQFAKYYRSYGWKNHRNRARFVYDCIYKESSINSLDLIIQNEICLMEKGIPYSDQTKYTNRIDMFLNKIV